MTQIDNVAQMFTHKYVVGTIQEHNARHPKNMKAIYEEPEDEFEEPKYSEYAQMIYDEKFNEIKSVLKSLKTKG